MLRQPWFNFGLWLGEDEAPTNDNVVGMPEALYRALPDDYFETNWGQSPASTKHDDLSAEHRRLAWRAMGREGEPPRMRLVIRYDAVKAALERVMQQERPLVETVQARLDSYTTNKQRKQRIKELERQMHDNDGFSDVGEAIERMALMLRLKFRKAFTAKEIENSFYNDAIGGKMRLFVNIDGEHVKLPQDVIRRSILH